MRRLAVALALALAVAVAIAGCGSSRPPARHPARPGVPPVVQQPVRVVPAPRGDPEARADGQVVAGGARCGRERWGVKTLTDPAAGHVDLTPRDATIAQLGANASTNPGNPDQPRDSAVESRVYRVTATLVSAKLEADSDFHLVLDDGQGHTMVAEIPDAPACTQPPVTPEVSVVGQQLAQVRAAFVSEFGEPGAQWTDIGHRVTVTGVGFFDVPHGQRGELPDQLELHPLLSIADP